ncbi:NADP-dependent oxidoreductase [Nocardiopsis ansamitocini]|uniref:Alcohol dehydrogenase n=1 Tax=Nocardiopsis ansamitocini TaxID=1670832 RepID=A0A9W6UJR0_9ACTN|nr:NADP-dependent oxidoreductase [Nocardiopsis ansamitocini]GLU48320.1 alcohol dehydrogenase [Nocardiopsis ansamitocini]
MQGYVLTGYGNADVMQMREVPEPTVGPGELLIDVRAAGLNPLDSKLRRGGLKPLLGLKLPRVAGNELAGVVRETGAGVTGFTAGDRVFARVTKLSLGAFAPRVVVPADLAAKMPSSLDFTDAAGLPLAGLTALQALRDELDVQPGQRVFVSGGAGGVGTLAIQLATWMGAEVATTASAQGADLVRSLGAKTIIDYKEQKFAEHLRDYDGALDLIGGRDLTDIFTILKPGAKVVTIAGTPEPVTARKDLGRGFGLSALLWLASAKLRRQARAHRVVYRFLFMHPSGPDLALLARLVDEGRLKAVTDRVFPFEEIADAFVHLDRGRAKGKVVVRMTT